MALNLDEQRRLRDEAMSAGAGSARWIKCAQALMDNFPVYYETAKKMNERHAESCEHKRRLSAVIDAAKEWASSHDVNDWCEGALKKALSTLEGDRVEVCPGGRTVAQVHAEIDARLARLVRAGKLPERKLLTTLEEPEVRLSMHEAIEP